MQMNGATIHPLKPKILLFLGRQFTSSAAVLHTPFIESAHCDLNPLQFQFLLNPANLRGLTLTETKFAHALLLKTGVLHSNIVSSNNLANSYSECSRTECALKLFDEIPEPNLVSWNLMISGCNKNFLFDDSWRVFCQMHHKGVDMDEFTYGSILAASGALEHVKRGESVYGLVRKNGFFSNGYVRAGMVDLFSKSHRIEYALKVLYDVHCANIVCWNSVISGAVKNNRNLIALDVFNRMCCHISLIPNAFTFSSVLTACAALQELDIGESIHGQVIKRGAGADVFVGTATVDFYGKCGTMSDAIKQFKLMPVRNVVSWTAVISGFAQKGDAASAISILHEMRNMGEEMNNFTISSVLAACADSATFREAVQIHCWIMKIGFHSDSVVKASLITMYSKMGAINSSEIAFSETDRNLEEVGVWANMISAFVQNEIYEKAIILFKRMLKEGILPDKFITASVLSIIDDLNLGRQLHGYSIKAGVFSDVSVGSSIFSMYSKCGNLEASLKAFEQLEQKDSISWTSMIAGLAEHGRADEAIKLYRNMQFQQYSIDEVTLASLLTASSILDSVNFGKEIHAFSFRYGLWENTIIGAGLVNLYAKCGDLRSARIAFDMVPFKDQVSWSSLISGFAHRGYVEESLQLFRKMRLSDFSVNSFTISSILAITNKPSIGTQLHVLIIKMGLESEPYVGTSLVIMYSKCGEINNCRKVFRQIENPDLVTWTTMIHSYAQHGKGLEALQIYDSMKKSGIKPDAATFVGVLSACSHSGLVEEGYFHLNTMKGDYGIKPGYKHYACMVDLLGRAGRLDDAERFIINMPIEPDTLVWETLLSACKVHGSSELGKIAAEKIMELEPNASGAYISLSNICADAGEWENVVKIRGLMEEIRLQKKEPGWSFL